MMNRRLFLVLIVYNSIRLSRAASSIINKRSVAQYIASSIGGCEKYPDKQM